MSKTGLIVVVGAVSALSVGAGTFMAFRANQTPTPTIHDFETAQPVSRQPAPAPIASSVRPGSTEVADASQAPIRPVAPAPQRSGETSGSPRTAPVADSAPRVAAPPAPAVEPAVTPAATSLPQPQPPPVQSAEPPPATAAAAVTATPPVTTEPPVPAPAPKPRFEEVTVKADSVVGIKIDQNVSSETARVEDRITAKVSRDVTVDGRTAIAAGTKLEGVVTMVERGGKFKERSRLAIRFNTLVLADGLRVPIQTEAILREGDSPTSAAGSKIGAGAVAGAIIGGLIGGKRGAVIGTTAGAAGGTAVVASGGRNEALIQAGAPLTVRLTSAVSITIEREFEVR